MTVEQARELLGFTTPKSAVEQAKLASGKLKRFNSKTPLRFKVACTVLIRATK